jgi:hypothetical protein
MVPVVLPIGSRPDDKRLPSPSDSLELAREAILFVHRHAPAGPLFGPNGSYAEIVRFRPQYPSRTTMLGILFRHGTAPLAVLREAVGEEAIIRGRVKTSASYEDLVTALGIATDKGLAPGPGIRQRYLALRGRETFLPSWDALTKRAAPSGMTAAQLIEHAYTLRRRARAAAKAADHGSTTQEPGVDATETASRRRLTVERFCVAIRDASERYPTGPVFAACRPGNIRWSSVALDHNLVACPVDAARQLGELGTTADALIREALGADEAVVAGRVPVTSREDVIAILRAAIADGFDFSSGWTLRAADFGHARSYPFTAKRLRCWANLYCGGESTTRLVSSARTVEREHDTSRE